MNTTQHLRRAGGLVVAGALTALLAACGGSSSTASTTATSTSTSTAPAGATAAASTAAASAAAASAAPSASGAASGAATTTAAPAASTSPAPSIATTPVPAPGGGKVTETVAPSTIATPAPVPIGATAQPVSGAKVAIATKAAKLVAKVPGDVSGDGVLVTVTITNTGTSALPVGDTVVNLTGADGNPAPMFVGEPAKPITGSLAAGKSTTGTYAFRLTPAQHGKVRVEVRGNPVMGIAVYEGKA